MFVLFLHSNISSNQLDIDCYKYSINIKVNSKKKLLVDTPKRKKKKSQYMPPQTNPQHITRKDDNRERKEQRDAKSYKTMNKMAIVSLYLLAITLNVNRLSS